MRQCVTAVSARLRTEPVACPLRDEGVRCSRMQVGRLMGQAGIEGGHRTRSIRQRPSRCPNWSRWQTSGGRAQPPVGLRSQVRPHPGRGFALGHRVHFRTAARSGTSYSQPFQRGRPWFRYAALRLHPMLHGPASMQPAMSLRCCPLTRRGARSNLSSRICGLDSRGGRHVTGRARSGQVSSGPTSTSSARQELGRRSGLVSTSCCRGARDLQVVAVIDALGGQRTSDALCEWKERTCLG